MEVPRELSQPGLRTPDCEDAMKAYFTNLPAKAWVLLALPVIAVAYPVVTVVLPSLVRAVVPEVVRTVLHLI